MKSIILLMATVKSAVITQQPEDQLIAENADAEFVIKAKGSDVKFVWKKDGGSVPQDSGKATTTNGIILHI